MRHDRRVRPDRRIATLARGRPAVRWDYALMMLLAACGLLAQPLHRG
jgi:hypothetical protein